MWVLLIPSAVPGTPSSIVLHHVGTVATVALPYQRPQQFAWLASMTLLVEANTLCLIARRNLRQGSPAHQAANAAFYFTWVSQRLVGVPLLTVWLWQEWRQHSEVAGHWCNWLLLAPAGGFFLSGLSYFWTAQLLLKEKGRGRSSGEDRDRDRDSLKRA